MISLRTPNVYLYNIDDLQAIADGYLKLRKEEMARCEQIIREKARALLDGATPLDLAEGALRVKCCGKPERKPEGL